MITRPGTYADVCAIPGGFAWVWSADRAVVCERDSEARLWQTMLPESGLWYARVAASPFTDVAAVGQGHDSNPGRLWFVVERGAFDIGPCYGQDVAVIRWAPDLACFEVWAVADRATYQRILVSTGGAVLARQSFPLAPGRLGTSQGLRDVNPDGSLIWGDPLTDNRYGVHGRVLSRAHVRGTVIAGEKNEGGEGASLAWVDEDRYVTVFGKGTQPPNVAVSGDRIAVCAWTPQGASLVVYSPPYPVGERLVDVPPIQIPPPVIPVPQQPPVPTEPQPMSTPNRLEIAQRIANQHPELVRLNTSVACGTLTEYIALALHAEDPNWGLLSKSAGENQYRGHAVDAVIYQATQQVIDLMSGAGDRDPGSTVPLDQQFDIRVKWQEVGKRSNNNWMAPVPSGGTPPPPPQPPPSAPPPATDLAALLERVNKLEQAARTALHAGDLVALKTDNDSYVCAELGGGGDVNATRRSAGGWETFELEKR